MYMLYVASGSCLAMSAQICWDETDQEINYHWFQVSVIKSLNLLRCAGFYIHWNIYSCCSQFFLVLGIVSKDHPATKAFLSLAIFWRTVFIRLSAHPRISAKPRISAHPTLPPSHSHLNSNKRPPHCYDHFFIFISFSAVHIWFISHIINKIYFENHIFLPIVRSRRGST